MFMPRVEIFSSPYCPYCHRAKALLDRKGVAYEEINVALDPSRRSEMMKRSGGQHTVPQIFVDGEHIGDCDGIHMLDRRGELDSLLRD